MRCRFACWIHVANVAIGHVRHLRGADPFAQYWDATLYGNLKTPLGDISDDGIVQLRVLKPWSSFLRIADPRRHCDDDWPYLFWDRILPTDVMVRLNGRAVHELTRADHDAWRRLADSARGDDLYERVDCRLP